MTSPLNTSPLNTSPLITSRRNPLVKRLKRLATREGRLKEGLLILEGTHLLQEVIAHSAQPVELIATPAWVDRHGALVMRLPKALPIQLVSQDVLTASLSTVTPDGVACLFPLTALPKPPQRSDFLLVLDRIQDPGNLGTLLRTALAADVHSVWLGSGADPLASKVLRASAGALLQLHHSRFGPEETAAVAQLQSKLKQMAAVGMQVVASLVPDTDGPLQPIPYWELDWTQPTALVLGTEGAGLHPTLQQCCTTAVTLPHSSRIESLNVAAAAVPLLLERRRATMTATSQQSG